MTNNEFNEALNKASNEANEKLRRIEAILSGNLSKEELDEAERLVDSLKAIKIEGL